MDLHLKDLVAVVTGSSRGLGLASARSLAAEGCRVCLCARGVEQLEHAAQEVRAAGRADDIVLAVPADLTKPEGIEKVFEAVRARWGGVDILVNNLGLARGAGILETTRRGLAGGVRPHALSRPSARPALAVPDMRRRGGGSIIMIASIFGREAGGRMTYNAVKAAEISLAKVAGAAARARQHPREQRRAGVHPVPGRVLVEAPAGRPRGHRGVRPPRAPVRPVRARRRGGRRRRVPRVAAGQLDQRREHHRRRLPVAVADLRPCLEPVGAPRFAAGTGASAVTASRYCLLPTAIDA